MSNNDGTATLAENKVLILYTLDKIEDKLTEERTF